MSDSTDVQTNCLPRRILSIDALRGFDMFWIMGPECGHWVVTATVAWIFGSVPPWLKSQMDHPAWVGFSAWDMIMPLFLFIVGAAMPFSIGRRLDQGASRWDIYVKSARRVLLLWMLGMICQGDLLSWQWSSLKWYSNTLQAISAGYLITIVSLVELRTARRCAVCAAALLVVYWLLMSFVPVPGHGTGVYSPDGNLAIWIDKTLMGNHQDGTTYTWILSSIGFGATVLIGSLAGMLLKFHGPGARSVLLLAAAGLACLAVGWIWSWYMPVIKHLWTSSMVLWAAGWSLLLLALFHWIIDVRGWCLWAFPFRVIGANAIVAYMVQPLFDIHRIATRWFGGLAAHCGQAHDVVLAALTTGMVWFVLWWLYHRRIYVRI